MRRIESKVTLFGQRRPRAASFLIEMRFNPAGLSSNPAGRHPSMEEVLADVSEQDGAHANDLSTPQRVRDVREIGDKALKDLIKLFLAMLRK